MTAREEFHAANPFKPVPPVAPKVGSMSAASREGKGGEVNQDAPHIPVSVLRRGGILAG
jgi:hypothetical protein